MKDFLIEINEDLVDMYSRRVIPSDPLYAVVTKAEMDSLEEAMPIMYEGLRVSALTSPVEGFERNHPGYKVVGIYNRVFLCYAAG